MPLREKRPRLARFDLVSRQKWLLPRGQPALESFGVRDGKPRRLVAGVQVRDDVEGAPALEGRRTPPGRRVQRRKQRVKFIAFRTQVSGFLDHFSDRRSGRTPGARV